VALDALVISFWAHKKGDPLYKIVFNVCALPLTIWLAAHLFFILAGIRPLVYGDAPVVIRDLLVPLLIFTVVYFGLNSWIITFAIALERRLPPVKIWRENFVWLSLNYAGGASVAALLVTYTKGLDFTYLAVIVPLLVVLYFTFSMSMGRIGDANRHLTQLNSLYMSTIETLAMAIDAKDQITHGHIRRVQTYAVALAKEMGVSDEKLIRAVEAAALLHDMGKLAVPEYILNKPGPLTPAEFEKMKLHASVGADILSSIDFPYPVVPIVRHHHESWNGTGYPDRLSGSAIPIGARILSVVDCFDALTSDRPYRPRLPDKEAIRILRERRGTMYDPLVVDTFIQLHPTIVAPVATNLNEHPLAAITNAGGPMNDLKDQSTRLEDITSSAGEVVSLFALAHALGARLKPGEVGRITFAHLRRLVPHSFGVLFVYSHESDQLIAADASGESASLLTGMTVAVGQRLTGWVAANRQTIRNSDPVLDLGEVAKTMSPRPRSCLSTPLTLGSDLVGVLTLYSTQQDFFTEEHERLIEATARQVGPALSRALEHEDETTGYRRSTVSHEGSVEVIDRLPDNTCLVLIERSAPSQALEPSEMQTIVDALAAHLQAKDLVFRRGTNQLAIMCEGRDISAIRLAVSEALSADYNTKFAVTSVPDGGRSVDQLLATADGLLAKESDRGSAGRHSVH
jgi:putative nucleotidyltransferase with HDIG domain